MSFGLQIRNANGKVIYNSDSITWNQALAIIVNPGERIVRNIPAIIGREVVYHEAFLSMPNTGTGAIASAITVDTATGEVIIVGGQVVSYVMVFMR